MQTFLPYPQFDRSAAVLDRARLGKQRVEVLQILRALRIEGYGWRTHPAVTMWTGHVEALVSYGEAVNLEWAGRGHGDSTRLQIVEFAPCARPQAELAAAGALPPWLGDEALHRSHRSALVRKDPAHYRPLFGDVPDDLPYHWPDAPAAPPAEVHPFSAWAVRADAPDALGAMLAHGVVALASRDGDEAPSRRGKRHRVLDRFRAEIAPGDVVVVPLAEREVLVGEVAGDYEWRHLAPLKPVHHVRPARWRGFVPRAALRDPSALQDPSPVFALRGEDALLLDARAAP